MRQRGVSSASAAVIVAAMAGLALAACSSLGPTVIGATPDPPLPDAPDAPPPITMALSDQPITFANQVDELWLDDVSAATGIPRRALVAYAGAAVSAAASKPQCGITWATIAAIGAVESRHGTVFGGEIGASGDVTEPIVGPALDGVEFDAIADSDGGVLDGDTEWDRAVGPMQLIPQSWANWHVDANGDGVENPQNIDDAAVATANYLCRAGHDTTTVDGWRATIRTYNGADSYLLLVIGAAQRYAEATAR